MNESSEQPPSLEPSGAPGPSQAEIEAIHLKLQKQRTHANGSGWFYWIAGLSLITSIVSLSGGSWSFLAGLGVTQVFDGFALGLEKAGAGGWVKGLSLGLDLLAAAFFVVVGLLARKGRRPAYIVGLVCYGLDSLILLAFREWLGAGFHAFALFQIWTGYGALRWLEGQGAAPVPQARTASPGSMAPASSRPIEPR